MEENRKKVIKKLNDLTKGKKSEWFDDAQGRLIESLTKENEELNKKITEWQEFDKWQEYDKKRIKLQRTLESKNTKLEAGVKELEKENEELREALNIAMSDIEEMQQYSEWYCARQTVRNIKELLTPKK